jgi:hypothetical protein
VDVNSSITLDGTLNVTLLRGFVPGPGDSCGRLLYGSGSSSEGMHWHGDHCPYDDGPVAGHAPRHTCLDPNFSRMDGMLSLTSDDSDYARFHECRVSDDF